MTSALNFAHRTYDFIISKLLEKMQAKEIGEVRKKQLIYIVLKYQSNALTK